MLGPAAFAHAMTAQDPALAEGGSFWQWLLALGSEKGVVETLLAVTMLALIVFAWWRLARLVTGARSRRALQDYLLGVEQALHGNLEGAHDRLTSVVQTDPENHYARLLLGKVLAELGQPTQAHTQHLYLQRGFGIESPENDLLLARSLLAAGLPAEAADAADRVLARAPERAEGWEFSYRARLQAGDFEAAAAAGKRLLDLLRDGGQKAAYRRDLARTLAQAGAVRLGRGDIAGAGNALQGASRLDGASDALPLLAARMQAAEGGVEQTVRRLLAEHPDAAALVPAANVALVPTAGVPAPLRGLPMAALAGLAATSRWSCRACGLPLHSQVVECPRCFATGAALPGEPNLTGHIESPTHTMDGIDVNDAHLARLVRTLLDGEGTARAQARGELLDLRERAVEELLRQAWHRGGDAQDCAIEALRAMGPEISPALFAASDALEHQRLLPIGSRSPAAIVGRVVQGFDRSALPHVGSLFASARPEHRKILIDFFLGLADLGEFQLVLERFPPLEILHRFNKADGAVLRRFLQAVPAGHFVAEVLLLEPTFDREEEVLAAIPGARHPEVLQQALRRRGASRTLTKVLIAALGNAELAGTAQELLVHLGAPVLDHVLSAYTDAELPAGERRLLAEVLRRMGPLAVEEICSSFGPEPRAQDDEVVELLVGIGDPAVQPLQEAYEHSGWLERVSIGLISRHTNRRVQILRTLRRIGSPAAAEALRMLLAAERDPNLRLHLERCLREIAGAEGGDDGAR